MPKRTHIYVGDLLVHRLVRFNRCHLVSAKHFLMSQTPAFSVAPSAGSKLSSPSTTLAVD